MRSIIVLSTAVLQGRRPSLENRTGDLDDADDVLTLTSPLKRRDRSGSHSRGRDHGSMPGDGNNGDDQDSNQPGHCSKHPYSPDCQTHSGPYSSDSSSTTSSASGDMTIATTSLSSTTGSTPSGDIGGLGSALTSTPSSLSSSSSSQPLSASTTDTLSDPDSTVAPPTTLTSLTPQTIASAGAESSPAFSPQAAVASHAHKTGAIVGGVIGGIVLLVLAILGTILFLRQRRRKRIPASAEFRDRYIPRSTAPPRPLATQTSGENLDELDGPPPPFTPGNFTDPLFEKIRETQQAHVTYGLAR